MACSSAPFGTLRDGTPVAAWRLEKAGLTLTVLDYGAAIQSLLVPDRDGKPVDVVLGYDTAGEYEANGDYFGAAIGRVGNRIAGAEFSLNGEVFHLAKNDGENHLHGGLKGFDKQMWTVSPREDSLVCARRSPDGEEGYPGNLDVTVTYTLTEDMELRIEYDADTDRDTLVNLTNHSFFNLNGGGDIADHLLTIYAGRFCENGPGCLPTGRLLPVADTPFDFRWEKRIGQDIGADDPQLRAFGGYDHNYCLAGRRAAMVRSADNGVCMTVDTDMPGMQLYTSNFMSPRTGKGGARLDRRYALCLETQLYPNGMMCYGFPSPVLRAGKHLHSETVYGFQIV